MKQEEKRDKSEIRKEIEKRTTDAKGETSHREEECEERKVRRKRDRDKGRKRSYAREEGWPNRLLIYTSALAWKDDGGELASSRDQARRPRAPALHLSQTRPA